MFLGYLERMCIMSFFHEMFYKCQLDPNWTELLVNGVIEFWVFAGFVRVPTTVEKISKYNCRVFFYFSSQFYHSWLHLFLVGFGANTFGMAMSSFVII